MHPSIHPSFSFLSIMCLESKNWDASEGFGRFRV